VFSARLLCTLDCSHCLLAESTRNVVHARSQVFGSHASNRHTSMCTWDAEYGDGYFSVGQNILGDFTVVCRYCVCQCALLQNCRDVWTIVRWWCVDWTYAATSSAVRRLQLLTSIVVNMGT
jgi:hypothetical protein